MTQQLERRDPTQKDEEEDEDEQMDDEDGEDSGSDSESEGDEDEDEEDGEPDLELRSKIEEALRASGIEPADDSEGEDESEEEEIMDDDQMMAIDDKLAEIFRSRANEKKSGKGVESPPFSQFVRVDSRLLQMQMPNVRLPTSRTAFSTLWIFTSRNNHPALISRSWFHLYSSLSSLPARKKASCRRRRLVSFVHVSESSRSTRTRMNRLLSVLFSRICTRRLVAHPPRMALQRSANAVVIWLEPLAITALMAQFVPCTANPFKTL